VRRLTALSFTLAAGAVLLLDRLLPESDAEQIRLCRLTLPALQTASARTDIVRVAGLGERGIRIDYWSRPLADHEVRRFVICRFGAGTARYPELTELATESGPISGAALYLLKNFHLNASPGPDR
jgi:branched-chain amino acid transport system permease protein